MKPRETKLRLWTSYILQGLVVILFLMGATMNILQTEAAVAGSAEMGYPKSSVIYLGVVLLISTILYVIPKTTVLGAILLTGWLGGAIATHVIHKDPIVNVLLPFIFGIVVWGSIWLRNEYLRQITPLLR